VPTEHEVVVARVAPPVTYPLRQRVLRPGRPVSAARFDVDDDPRTATFAACTPSGHVVGTSLVYPGPCPWLPDRTGCWRLRGMATEPALRSRGVGRRLLDAALDHVRAAGGEVVWCTARVPAQRFYERAGFKVHGDPWDDPEFGPHVAMWREL
jgi:GNAT superfamily N-acetyltransferase